MKKFIANLKLKEKKNYIEAIKKKLNFVHQIDSSV